VLAVSKTRKYNSAKHGPRFGRGVLNKMQKLSLLLTLLREKFCRRRLLREPEPDLVMESVEQVEAYALAGRIDGVMSAGYLYHSAQISMVIAGCGTVLDLGCGPATQLGQIAELNPDIKFVGVDLSESMIENARAYVGDRALSNVTFVCDDMTRLDRITDNSVDAVVSTMALHHLPTIAHLESCFRQIKRILKPNGAIYITDFGRLKHLRSVFFFAYMNRDHQPHIFSLDYERSLRAAFEFAELKSVASKTLPPNIAAYSTFLVPFLAVIKTPSRPLTERQRQHLIVIRQALPQRYRKDLDELRRFFRWGGLAVDPFC